MISSSEEFGFTPYDGDDEDGDSSGGGSGFRRSSNDSYYVNYAEEYQTGANRHGGYRRITISRKATEALSKKISSKVNQIISEVWE